MSDSRGPGPLRLRLQFLRAQESGKLHTSLLEPQSYILPTPGGGSPSARFEWSREVLDELRAVHLPGRDPEVVQRLGDRLSLFIEDAGWKQHRDQIEQALDAGRQVILTIRSSAAELYVLPWELLTLRSGRFIGDVEEILVRYEWPDSPSRPEEPRPRPEGGRILFAWSAAGGTLPVAPHLRAIELACHRGSVPFDAKDDVLEHLSLGRLAAVLADAKKTGRPIAALHLLCHGGSSGSSFGLVLNGRDGATVVTALELRQVLAPFASMVRLVVLAACESGRSGEPGHHLGSVAQTLHSCGFATVIASRFLLAREASNRFSEVFYRELLIMPSSVETAFLAARTQLGRDDVDLPIERRGLEWASLQLYAQSDDGDDSRPIVLRPYRGLLAFLPEHRRFFFGRDPEIQEILADLQRLCEAKTSDGKPRPRLLIVAGASGTGKSSLVLAGAAPLLCAQSPMPKYLCIRPGKEPMQGLRDALAQLPEGRQGLLVVDQFEEVFTQTADPKLREEFARALWKLATSEQPDVRVLLTLRVDFIGRCGELVLNDEGLRLDRVTYDEAHRVFIAQMKKEQMHEAIVEPARKVGLELQAGLAQRMIEEVSGEPGALPMLQDALDVLWQHRDGRILTAEAYEALGGVVGALQKRADATVDRLTGRNPDRLRIIQHLLTSLVALADDTAMDTRQRVALTEVRRSLAGEDAAALEEVLKELVAARLLVLGGDEQSPQVEVAHEALIRRWPRLRAWIAEDRAGLIMKQRIELAARQWSDAKREESLLYRGAQLVQAAEWRKTWEPRMEALLREFLDSSQQAESERQRLREREELELHERLLTVIAQTLREDPTTAVEVLREGGKIASPSWMQVAVDALACGISRTILRGLSPGALRFSPDGKRLLIASNDAEPRLYGADAADRWSPEPTLLRGPNGRWQSAVFCADGLKLAAGTPDSFSIWRWDGTSDPVRIADQVVGVSAVALSPDGERVAVASGFNQVHLFSAPGAQLLRVLQVEAGLVWAISWSPDGETLALGGHTGLVFLASLAEGAQPVPLPAGDLVAVVFAWSPDGRRLLAGSLYGQARIWNRDGSSAPVDLIGHGSPVRAVAWSPNGQKVLTGSEDHTARIWNADGSGEPVILKGHSAPLVGAAWSPDGQTVATCAEDGTARLWLAAGNSFLCGLGEYAERASFVRCNLAPQPAPEGPPRVLVQPATPDGPCAPVLDTAPGPEVRAVALSPDGRLTAVGAADNTVQVGDAVGGEPVALRGHAGLVTAIAFSPDGKRIASAAMDHTVRIWKADGSGAPLVFKMSTASIHGVAWSPDGQVVAIRCAEGANEGERSEVLRLLPATPQTLIAALWNATSDCLPFEQRCKLLFESREQAVRADALARQELARRWRPFSSGRRERA